MFSSWARAGEGDPAEAKVRRRVVWLLAVDAVLILLLSWLGVQVRNLGYRFENTGKLIEKLDLEYAELVAENARVTSPERLRAVAQGELGLRIPAAGQVVTLDAEP